MIPLEGDALTTTCPPLVNGSLAVNGQAYAPCGRTVDRGDRNRLEGRLSAVVHTLRHDIVCGILCTRLIERSAEKEFETRSPFCACLCLT